MMSVEGIGMVPLRASALWLVVTSTLVCAQNAYVGSKACFGCHPAIYESFQKTDMGRSLRIAGEWKPEVASSDAATVTLAVGSRSYSVAHDQSGWKQTESEAGVFSLDRQLDYVVGTGYNGLTFLIRRGNYLFQAPLSFYSKTQKWDLSPGYEQSDLGFNRKVPQECINCHAGRPAALKDVPGAYADPPFRELAIGCENCHGPGGRHVKSSGRRATIVNPAKLAPALADNICLNCHQSGGARVTQPGKSYLDFRPGQWLYDTAIIFKQPAAADDGQSDLLEHFSAMQASRCFRESAGKLSCLTCHDPHVQPRAGEASSYYRGKCLGCHNDQSCRLPLSARQGKDDCIGCHMAKREVAEISHSALTNHRIPSRGDEPAAAAKQDIRDGLVIVDPPAPAAPPVPKLILLRAYQQMAQKKAEYQSRYLSLLDELEKSHAEDPFVQAALGDRAFKGGQSEDAIAHLKLALPLANAGVFLELGQSLTKLGRHEEAIEYLKKGIAIDPYDAEMQKTLILQYINLRLYVEARQRMQQYVADFPEDSFMRSLLARVSK